MTRFGNFRNSKYGKITRLSSQKGQKMKFHTLVFALFLGLLAQNALAKPPHDTPPHLAGSSQYATPPHLAGYTPHQMHQLPHIKGINDEIFLAASLEKQIKALQIDSQSKASERKATQKLSDERHGLELDKKVLQARLLRAQDEAQRQSLLTQLHQNELKLSNNRIAEREIKDKAELQRLDAVYKALR